MPKFRNHDAATSASALTALRRGVPSIVAIAITIAIGLSLCGIASGQSVATEPPGKSPAATNTDEASTVEGSTVEATASPSPDASGQREPEARPAASGSETPKPIAQPGETWKQLGKESLWIDVKAKQLMVRGIICLREGPLEMFACPRNTKEHESIVSVDTSAMKIHASLIALGAEPGTPVQWDPEYKTAVGPAVPITVRWKDTDGKVIQRDAKEMVRKNRTDQTLQTDWVFVGSRFFTDQITGEKTYYADSGEMVCLSNFSTAMMDVPIQSSDAADGLLFVANTDRIPPVNTIVQLIFKPKVGKTSAGGQSDDSATEASATEATK